MAINVYDLSIKDIYYVLALAEYKHFGQAAEACLVSQPALTKQIKNIERLLGVTIFERTKRRVDLTSQGYAIVEQARSVIDSAQTLINVAESSHETLVGKFNLGAIRTMGPYLIPRFLPKVIKRYPKLELILHEGFTHELLAELKRGHLDAVIASTPIEDESLEYQELFFEPFVLAVNKNDPLAKRKLINPDDLDSKKMILLEEGNCLTDQSWALCPTKSKGEAFQYQATSLETLSSMVATGLGYSIVPRFAQTKDLNLARLVKYVDFKQKNIGRDVVLVYRKNYSMQNNITNLKDLISQSY